MWLIVCSASCNNRYHYHWRLLASSCVFSLTGICGNHNRPEWNAFIGGRAEMKIWIFFSAVVSYVCCGSKSVKELFVFGVARCVCNLWCNSKSTHFVCHQRIEIKPNKYETNMMCVHCAVCGSNKNKSALFTQWTKESAAERERVRNIWLLSYTTYEDLFWWASVKLHRMGFSICQWFVVLYRNF